MKGLAIYCLTALQHMPRLRSRWRSFSARRWSSRYNRPATDDRARWSRQANYGSYLFAIDQGDGDALNGLSWYVRWLKYGCATRYSRQRHRQLGDGSATLQDSEFPIIDLDHYLLALRVQRNDTQRSLTSCRPTPAVRYNGRFAAMGNLGKCTQGQRACESHNGQPNLAFIGDF